MLLKVLVVAALATAWVAPSPRARARCAPRALASTSAAPSDANRSLPDPAVSLLSLSWPATPPPAAADDEAMGLADVLGGCALFVACELNALLVCKELGLDYASADAVIGPVLARVLGTGSFLALQSLLAAQQRAPPGAAAAPPPIRGLGWAGACRARWDDARDVRLFARPAGDATPPLARAVAWPTLALGCSAPALAWLVAGAAFVSASALGSDDATAAVARAAIVAPPVGLGVLAETCVLTPACEELVFRGWALGAARRARVPYPLALAASALAFGVWHIDASGRGAASAARTALLGASWGHAYAQSGNILVPIAMHVVWNSAVVGVRTIEAVALGSTALG